MHIILVILPMYFALCGTLCWFVLLFLQPIHETNRCGCLTFSGKRDFLPALFLVSSYQLPISTLPFVWAARKDPYFNVLPLEINKTHTRMNAYGRNVKAAILRNSEWGCDGVVGPAEKRQGVYVCPGGSIFHMSQWEKMLCPCCLCLATLRVMPGRLRAQSLRAGAWSDGCCLGADTAWSGMQPLGLGSHSGLSYGKAFNYPTLLFLLKTNFFCKNLLGSTQHCLCHGWTRRDLHF